MDQETLINHVRGLSKAYFDVACQIVLKDYFNISAINVDGSNDGGADFVGIAPDGSRNEISYQLTTQKEKVPEKLGRDVKKAVEKLNSKRFFFLTTHNTSEITARKLEHQYTQDLEIPVTFYGARHIAGFLLDGGLLNRFIDAVNYPLPRTFSGNPDYKEMALYGYTIMSEDARGMREGIYDDTIIFVLSDNGELAEEDVIEKSMLFLNLEKDKEIYLKGRIGALFSKGAIIRSSHHGIMLSQRAKDDILARKRIYEQEIGDLSSAQIDIMRRDFGIDWTLDNSKEISIHIADAYISQQMELLNDIKAKIAIEPILSQGRSTEKTVRDYIKEKTGLPKTKAADAAFALIQNASNHPLITKLARASVYVALEGRSAVASAKSFGASRWSDFSIIVEPSVAIPWICSQLYSGNKSTSFEASKKSVARARTLDAKLFIPYYYINECASHLLRAKSYAAIENDGLEEELQHSPNAFISNYYTLKNQGARVPNSIIEYLKTFSPAVQVENHDWKAWVRSAMTDIQSILKRSGVDFIEMPFYNSDDCVNFQREYSHYLADRKQQKSKFLMDHDIWTLQFTHSETASGAAHWAILTFDKAMIKVGAGAGFSGWIVTPNRFLDITSLSNELSDTQYSSLVHSLASSSERTLALGARIIDRALSLASNEFQNWEFKLEFEGFRKNLISDYDLEEISSIHEVDIKIDEFLREKGVVLPDKTEEDDDAQSDSIE